MTKKMNQFQVGVAAEAFVASQFARCGYDVSVQYGANQPEYDLIIAKEDKLLKISVKGSQDGGWGLTQSYKKGVSYHEAIDKWLSRHNQNTVMALVQFMGIPINESPRLYLAFPSEIAEEMKKISKGRGDTVLREEITWGPTANGYGTTDKIPESWRFSSERIEELLNQIYK